MFFVFFIFSGGWASDIDTTNEDNRLHVSETMFGDIALQYRDIDIQIHKEKSSPYTTTRLRDLYSFSLQNQQIDFPYTFYFSQDNCQPRNFQKIAMPKQSQCRR